MFVSQSIGEMIAQSYFQRGNVNCVEEASLNAWARRMCISQDAYEAHKPFHAAATRGESIEISEEKKRSIIYGDSVSFRDVFFLNEEEIVDIRESIFRRPTTTWLELIIVEETLTLRERLEILAKAEADPLRAAFLRHGIHASTGTIKALLAQETTTCSS